MGGEIRISSILRNGEIGETPKFRRNDKMSKLAKWQNGENGEIRKLTKFEKKTFIARNNVVFPFR